MSPTQAVLEKKEFALMLITALFILLRNYAATQSAAPWYSFDLTSESLIFIFLLLLVQSHLTRHQVLKEPTWVSKFNVR
jgi:hypothetical protein